MKGLNYIKTVIMAVIGVIIIGTENAAWPRILLISLPILIILIAPFMKNKFNHFQIIEVISVIVLMIHSKFPINYFALLMGIVIMAENIFKQSFEKGLGISMGIIIGTGYHFYLLNAYQVGYQYLSQMIFVLMSLIFILVLLMLSNFYHQEKNKVSSLNTVLLEKNEALEKAQTEIIKLTKIRERNDIASDLHDTIGHELTGLIMELEMAKRTEKPEFILDQAASHARHILRQTRVVVLELKEKIIPVSLRDQLNERIQNYSLQTGIEVSLAFDIWTENFSEMLNHTIYSIILESMTNTAKHSKATQIWISIMPLEKEKLILKIFDNGNNTGSIILGSGLQFMKNRVESLQGKIEFKKEVDGFYIMIVLPIEVTE